MCVSFFAFVIAVLLKHKRYTELHRVPTGSRKMKKVKSGPEKSWIWTLVLTKCWLLVTVVVKNQFSRHVGCDTLMKQLCKYTYNCKCYNLCFLCACLHLGPKYCNYCCWIFCSRPEIILKQVMIFCYVEYWKVLEKIVIFMPTFKWEPWLCAYCWRV